MSLKITAITEQLAVAPQIAAADIADIAAKGYRTLVNNRPDNEAPGQLPSEEARRLAEKAGLRYEYFPITAPTLTSDQVDEFSRLLAGLEGPVLAYCRSGSRCSLLWAATELRKSRTSPDTLIRKLAERGFDISSLTRFA